MSRILMLSLDKTFLGVDYSGDALERHQEYAQRAGHLDIIVFSKRSKGLSLCTGTVPWSSPLKIYPTNSRSKFNYFFDAIKIAQEIYQKNKFDLVVTQDPFLTALVGWWIKKKFKVPLLIHFHGDFWQNRYWLKERWLNWLLLLLSRFLVRRADGIRVVSSGIKEKLIRVGIDSNKIRVIPTPINLEKFKPAERTEHKQKTIINVGRRDTSKDYPTLFKAIELVEQKNKKFVFCQIGAGWSLREKIKAGDNLVLISTKKISQTELIQYYQAADIYVSSSCHESFGKVLVEAMACGLPVVATATTGSKEIVRDNENGFLVPISNAAGLAEKILFLLDNPEKARQMGERGEAMVKEKFNQEKIISQIIEFWHDLTNA